ncbi:glycoside hydrolase family 88 protein [Paenibacillus roseipurpureus]|uniref:Glycoside hydrolase family 88 protein n=1 Tax=Paenibacillus roseopurpureus TaxID=2918901 RepID=A0AA96LQD0_9BACL|nr:glycoside hydrolase family 88 protein [Paenibacillus sp. MBLB1832]WNR42940.1 glycoside hydrolase family 88 protein [Paenibacillus sp. MBLB1832]
MQQHHTSFIENTWSKIERKLSVTSRRIKDGMPFKTIDGVYDDWQDLMDWWTNTFWAGILWHMYRETKEEIYRTYAQSIEEKMDQVLHEYDKLHHDVGFMWLLSSVMNHELTGDDRARQRGLLAANVLSGRANIAGGYIRAWNGDNKAGWAIIDCMMNIPLLFWASEKSKDARFTHIGTMHADKVMRDFVRPDGSVHHIVIYDETNGEVLETPRGQGYEVGSSWSRGQSWALYGFAQSYHWTGKQEYLDTAKRIAHYVMTCLPLHGYVPPCDYRQPEDSELLDSSAGAITACGLIEIAKAVPPAEQRVYLESAIAILRALDEKCAIWDHTNEGLLDYGTGAFHKGIYTRAEVFNGPMIYGDYYYVEAICKLKKMLG